MIITKRNSNPPSICTVQDCFNKHCGKGFCNKHLKKFHKYRDPLGKAQPRPLKICIIDECFRKVHAYNYCSAHASRFKKYGNPLGKPLERPLKLSGGWRIIGHGEGRYIKKHKANQYWMILCPCHPNADKKGYVLEHRLVMEVFLGKFLSKNEHIHHKNGNSLDNFLENLELVTQQEHSQIHKYWINSPRKGNVWSRKSYNLGKCKKEGCNKQAKAKEYCSNHNRDIWRQKRRHLKLAYT